MFALVNTGVFSVILLTLVISYTVCQNALAGSQGAWFPELFTAARRASGASLAYQISAMVSGFTPFITTLLFVTLRMGRPGAAVQRVRGDRPDRCPRHPGDLRPAERQIAADAPRAQPVPVDLTAVTSLGRTATMSTTTPTGPSTGGARSSPTGCGTTCSTWARSRVRATSARPSARPTCSPRSMRTGFATAPTTRTGTAATGSCSPPATTRSACTRRSPRPGIVPIEELVTYGSDDSRLPMSGMASYTPGMEISGGSLGHGLPVAVGLALGLRYRGSAARVYNFLSDGELNEGSTWEAAMGAAHHRLGNLTALVDINALQADGPTAGRAVIEPIHDKWAAFGWHVQRVDGNDSRAVVEALDRPTRGRPDGRPRVVLCDTKIGSACRCWRTGEGALHAHRRSTNGRSAASS